MIKEKAKREREIDVWAEKEYIERDKMQYKERGRYNTQLCSISLEKEEREIRDKIMREIQNYVPYLW